MTDIAVAITERDHILAAMDVPAAKAFISKHGGYISDRNLDWERVLHLARFDVAGSTIVTREMIVESQIYLARTGAQQIFTLPPKSPYLRMALDLLMPPTLMDEAKAEMRRRHAN